MVAGLFHRDGVGYEKMRTRSKTKQDDLPCSTFFPRENSREIYLGYLWTTRLLSSDYDSCFRKTGACPRRPCFFLGVFSTTTAATPAAYLWANLRFVELRFLA